MAYCPGRPSAYIQSNRRTSVQQIAVDTILKCHAARQIEVSSNGRKVLTAADMKRTTCRASKRIKLNDKLNTTVSACSRRQICRAPSLLLAVSPLNASINMTRQLIMTCNSLIEMHLQQIGCTALNDRTDQQSHDVGFVIVDKFLVS
jgi:hypothetical protein